jgi:hypothetical protein
MIPRPAHHHKLNRKKDIVRATATYAAVLVVFIGLGRIPLGEMLMAAGCFSKSFALKHVCTSMIGPGL